MPPDPHGATPVLARIAAGLAGVRRLSVVFSGGVDSSVLLAAAVRVLGPDHVVADLAVSPSLGTEERTDPHHVTGVIGDPVVEVHTREAD